MPHIDLAFRLTATQPLAADHGYVLYGAVSRLLPDAHRENGIAIHPIRGRIVGPRQMMLAEFSRLTLRVPDDRIADFLPLAGKPLRIGETTLRVGVPEVRPLIPAPALRSRLVTIKIAGADEDPSLLTADNFQTAARKQLTALGVSDQSALTLPKLRTFRIKHKEVVGYETIIECLTAEESLCVQEAGLGGRRHMGCGVFVPVGEGGAA